MAYPSGSGTEVLRNLIINNQTNDPTSFRWDGTDPTMGTETYAVPTNVIITVLNIVIVEQSNATRTCDLYVLFSGGADCMLLREQSFTAYGPAFIWNDKFVLHPTDKLIFRGSASASFDLSCSYLYQDWT